ncbi:MAG: hypothetical protein L6420_01205 [Elusimicrobia bacterium]|nr:hypothetical protein [Elusimicrobiota bacterium]
MYCYKCKRNIAKSGALKWFVKLTSKQRGSALGAMHAWLNTFTKAHKKLIAAGK